MVRSVWKGPFVEASLLKKADAARASGRHDVIKIWSRRSTILPQFVGLVFGVYNGQKHVPVSVDGKKCLESAIANAENNHDLEVDDLIVSEAHVGKGIVMKRFAPRGRGRSGRVFKPFSQLTIVVRQVEAEASA